MSTALIHIGLGITAFLVMLNGYLRGSAKQKIDVGLSMAWMVLLITAFVILGVWGGVIAVLASFVYGALSKPIAQRAAYRLLGRRTGIESSVHRSPTEDMIKGKLSVDDWLEPRLFVTASE